MTGASLAKNNSITGAGFAVCEAGRMLVDTVSPTRQAAIVNFLTVYRRVMVLRSTTAEQIEQAWQDRKGGADVHEVVISSKTP